MKLGYRLSSHMNNAKHAATPVASWLRGLQRRPAIIELARAKDLAEAHDLEQLYVAGLRGLLNVAAGGWTTTGLYRSKSGEKKRAYFLRRSRVRRLVRSIA